MAQDRIHGQHQIQTTILTMEDLHSMETEPHYGIEITGAAAEAAFLVGAVVVSIAFFTAEKGSGLFKDIADITGLTSRVDKTLDRLALLGSS